MRNANLFFLIIVIMILTNSCKKDVMPIYSVASLNVINAAPDVLSLDVNFSITPSPYYKYQNRINYGSFFEWGQPAGNIPVTIVSSADTTGNIYSNTLNLKGQAIYSLYVLSSKKGDELLLQDNIPAYQDIISGVRFINLSADSNPLTVNLQGNPATQLEFGPLAYKQISAFKTYKANTSGGTYNFEIRDPANPIPVATFSVNHTFGKNYTVVISGSELGGTINPFQVNNF